VLGASADREIALRKIGGQDLIEFAFKRHV
jgi:hypothetical protein